MLNAINSSLYSTTSVQENTRVTIDCPQVTERLINGGNDPTPYPARPVRGIESARPPQASNGPWKLSKGLIGKVLLAVVGGLAVAACGIASATTRRPEAFGVQRLPVPNRLIMSPEHQFAIESSQFGNETALRDELSHAPQDYIGDHLTQWLIEDISAREVARGEKIKELYPELDHGLDTGRKVAIAALKVGGCRS